jgi:hypothetical protein
MSFSRAAGARATRKTLENIVIASSPKGDEAIQFAMESHLDCFAELVIG